MFLDSNNCRCTTWLIPILTLASSPLVLDPIRIPTSIRIHMVTPSHMV